MTMLEVLSALKRLRDRYLQQTRCRRRERIAGCLDGEATSLSLRRTRCCRSSGGWESVGSWRREVFEAEAAWDGGWWMVWYFIDRITGERGWRWAGGRTGGLRSTKCPVERVYLGRPLVCSLRLRSSPCLLVTVHCPPTPIAQYTTHLMFETTYRFHRVPIGFGPAPTPR